MLLVHQTGAVKIGELVRYTITYEPGADRIVPSPTHLHVKIKNTSPIPLRAAYLNGPYTLHVAAYPSTFNPYHKLENPRRDGTPQFEPNLKAGSAFSAKLTVPEDIRVTSLSDANKATGSGERKSVTWILEVTSQVLFSSSSAVKFEVLVGRDEKSLDFSFTAVGNKIVEPSQIQDYQRHKRKASNSGKPKGVYSKAVSVVIDDTDSLWDRPALPVWELTPNSVKNSTSHHERKPTEPVRSRSKGKKKIHLVILTHGLHSNLGADMLYMKESIDATVKNAREQAIQRRRDSAKKAKTKTSDSDRQDSQREGSDHPEQGPTIAPLTGGQDEMVEDGFDDSDDEQVIVRGFTGNATKTENGIQYLGKRLARYVMDLTYPDQPVKFERKKTMSQKLSDSFSKKSNEQKDEEEGMPSHDKSRIMQEKTSNDDLAYTFTSISFIGHSLGGLIQLYAIAYIQKHAPKFFEHIKPVNFVALASPLLGLSNENPMYVKFALDFGLVGRTGQDLGLTWRAPTLAKSGWSAMVGGLGSSHKDEAQEDPGAKPLLRILPTGPAHDVLRRFRNRTLYSNVVNDGIVPLRTSCLLFLDWRGVGKVDKARRDNGLVGTMIGWGWAEMTGQNSVGSGVRQIDEAASDSEGTSDAMERLQTTVPQPAENAVNEDDETASVKSLKSIKSSSASKGQSGKSDNENMGAFEQLWSYIRPSGKTTKKDIKMFKRSQTLGPGIDETQDTQKNFKSNDSSRPAATRGDTDDDANNHHAPPKTTIFESAADLLSPPTPPISWIIDPSTRARTIFHDRVYHPEDIPPPPMPKPRRVPSGVSLESSTTMASKDDANSGGMRVEEKIARAYHRDLSWRKVLVRLEPDAHNNMIVRRMFANAYGWPVVKHLCDTHFGDTYSARTRDEDESALDRAKGVENLPGNHIEMVKGQESSKAPNVHDDMLRKTTGELKPLQTKGTEELIRKSRRDDSVEADESYLEDTEDEEEDRRSPFQRLWSPSQKSPASSNRSPMPDQETAPEIADELTAEPAAFKGSVRLSGRPDSRGNSADLGLHKPVSSAFESPRPKDNGTEGTPESDELSPTLSISEHIVRNTNAAEGS